MNDYLRQVMTAQSDRVHIHTTLPSDLYYTFRKKFEKKYGRRKGALREALIEAIKLWLIIADDKNVYEKKISTTSRLIEEIKNRGYVPLSEVNIPRLKRKILLLIKRNVLKLFRDKNKRGYLTLRRYYDDVVDLYGKGLLIVDVIEKLDPGVRRLAYFLDRLGIVKIDRERVIV